MISTFKRNQHFRKVLVNKAFTHAQEQKKAMPLRHSACILFSVRLRPLYKQINNYSYVRTIPTKWKKWAYNQFSYLLSSYLRIAIFKKALAGYPGRIHVLSTSHAVFMKSTSAKSRQESLFSADFKLCDVLECPNEARIGKRDPQ